MRSEDYSTWSVCLSVCLRLFSDCTLNALECTLKIRILRVHSTIIQNTSGAKRAYCIGGLGACPQGKLRISGLLKSSLTRFLSDVAETCCESAIVLANYIVDSDAT